MKKIIFFVSTFIALLVILPGCNSNYSTIPSTSVPSATQSTIPSTNNKQVTGAQSISIKGFAFSPAKLTINKGDTITWTNEDTAVHNVVGGILRSTDLAKGQSFSYTFTETGTYDYICTYHPSMKGNIIVK